MPDPLPSDAEPEPTLDAQNRAAAAPFGETLAPTTGIAPPTENKLIAGYLVERELGRGAMGVVYQARDGKLGRVVALKMILAGEYADLEDMQRFLTEAQAVAKLQHPNIVQVHEIGREGELLYFTQEFVPGGTLAARLKGEPQPPRAAARLVELLARGVEHAHQAGVIHRDLKPANVLLVEDAATPLERCTPKIADFGLAKRLEGGGVTLSGAIVGTPSYMAPEQAGGQTKQVGPLSDVYALGAVLYETLTGRPPFRATSTAETLLQVVADEPVTVQQLQPHLPRDLVTVCHKCLQKDPARRYASAAELADDLARFQKGEPIHARPVGRVERTWRWCQRNPVVAALLLLVSLASLFSVWQWRSAATALAQVRAEQQARALAQVTALGEAVPAAVPGVLKELEGNREFTLSRLRELWRDDTDRAKRMRVGLALLPVEPDAVRAELVRWLLETTEPDEAVLVRNALSAHGVELSAPLWRQAEDVKAKAEERFRCLVALAAFAPNDARWPGLARTAIAELVGSNPLHVRTWVQALRPVRASLLTALQEVYRTGSPERRELAAVVLSDYAGQDADLLTDLLLDADPKQYAVLFPVVQRYRAATIARMRRAVRGEEFWTDAPLDALWTAVPAATRNQLESADGLVAERWALCQTLPLEQLGVVCATLRASGYRPIRVRPWGGVGPASRAGPVRVAVVWARDGRAFAVESGLVSVQPRAGLIPVDVAAYRVGPQVRYAAVWVEPAANEKAGFYAGVAADKHRDALADFKQVGFGPLALHALSGGDGSTTYSGVWGNQSSQAGLVTWNNDETSQRGRVLLAERVLHDVSVGVADGPRYSSVWQADGRRGAEQTHGLSVAANLERCRELASQGYRPTALAVAEPAEGRTVTASAWQRPAPERLKREQLARRQATAAATLLRLEPAEEAWSLFRQRPDAEARSQLIWRGQRLGLKANQLVRRLEEEKDVSAKRALVLALGEYTEEQLPENERRPLVARLLQLYKDDPDAGLHGAIDWLLRHAKEGPEDRPLNWGQAQALAAIDKELQRGPTRGWYINGQGQTMIEVGGPAEFRLGAPPGEQEGSGDNDRPHRRRIPRSFALGARLITTAEFEEFLKDRPDVQHVYTKHFSPEPTTPVISVSWYQALQYCNWLSAKEGLPESEWCYPKHEDIKDGMELPADYLKRTGYRLPTEAEWEFAARSGAASTRYYGSSVELLPRYAWYLRNSEDRAWPVGQKRPNDAGFFDMHGNVWSWTMSRAVPYPEQRGTLIVVDREETGAVRDVPSRVLRGGSFTGQPSYIRLPYRYNIRPSFRTYFFGFRVARTIVAAE